MNRYVKKPIAIEAVKWKGFNNDEIKDFAGDSVKIEVIREGDHNKLCSNYGLNIIKLSI